jgi:hypothetical protein
MVSKLKFTSEAKLRSSPSTALVMFFKPKTLERIVLNSLSLLNLPKAVREVG